MRALGSLLLAVVMITAACTFNIDFLGKEKMEEVVLLKNPAKDKILVIDIAGMLTPWATAAFSIGKETSSPGLLSARKASADTRPRRYLEAGYSGRRCDLQRHPVPGGP